MLTNVNRAKKIYSYLIFFDFLVIFAASVLSFVNPAIGKIGMVFWFISYVFLLLFAVKSFIFIILEVFKLRAVFTLFVIGVWIFVIFTNLTSNKNLSGETTNEIRCAVNHMESSSDWGFNKTCLFGYPARQYFLPSFPTMIFGRSQFALNFGGSLYFIFGIIIFSAGILRFLKKKVAGDLFVAIILSMIFHFYYVLHFLFYFEQSIFPFSFALIICGLLFVYKETKSNESLFITGLLAFYLIYSYTPSLFFYFLLLIVFLYFITSASVQKNQKIYLMMIIVFSLISFILSLLVRSDINVYKGGRSSFDLLVDAKLALTHLVLQNQGNPIISPYLNYLFLLVFYFSYIYFFGGKFFVASLWILGVIIFSTISQGYLYYGIDFRLHRASVIFPVFLSMLAILFNRLFPRIKSKARTTEMILFVVFIFYLYTGLKFYNRYIKSRSVNYHLETINWFKQQKLISPNKNIKILVDPQTEPSYLSLYDYMQYFAPKGASSPIVPPECNFEIKQDADNFFLLGSSNPCLSKMPFDKLKLLKDNGIIKIYLYEK